MAWKYRVLFLVSLCVVVADQVVKRRVVAFFGGIEGAHRVIIPGFFDLVLRHNPGAAWSTFADLKPDGLRVAMFVTISLVASVVVVAFARRARPDQKLLVIALAFVLGGALGNLVDRVLAGTVVDFLEFYSQAGWMISALKCNPSWGCRFPDFNVADSSITVGTILLLATSLFAKEPAPPPAGKEPVPPPPVDAGVLP